MTLSVLQNIIIEEYKMNISGVLLSLVTSLNILGNPNNMVNDVKDGLRDLAALTKHSGGKGFIKGTKGLV